MDVINSHIFLRLNRRVIWRNPRKNDFFIMNQVITSKMNKTKMRINVGRSVKEVVLIKSANLIKIMTVTFYTKSFSYI